MSTATASLRGGAAVLPSDMNMKDLFNKLAAGDDHDDDHDHGDDTYDNVPADAEHCLIVNAACSIDPSTEVEVLHAGHKRCCTKTEASDGTVIYSHDAVHCNYVHGGPADHGKCQGLVTGEDLAVN